MLAQLGVETEKANGDLYSTYEILEQLKPVWDNLTEAQQAELGVTLAGKNQLKTLSSVLQAFPVAQESMTTALQASGSAMKENAAFMESLEAKTNALKAAWQDFATDLLPSGVVGKALELASGFLEILNTNAGRAGVTITVLTGVVAGLGAILNQLWQSNKYLLAIGTALTVLTVAFGALQKKWEENHRALEEFDESIEANSQKLKENQERIKEINNLPWNEKTEEILREKAALQAENEELEKNLELTRQEKIDRAELGLSDGETISVPSYAITIGNGAYIDYDTYEKAIEAQKIYGGEIITVYDDVKVSGEELYETLTNRANEYIKVLEESGELTEDQLVGFNETSSAMASQVGYLKTLQENGVRPLTEAELELIATYDNLMIAMNKSSKETDYMTDTLEDLANEAGVTKKEMFKLIATSTIFNNMDLDVDEKIRRLRNLGIQAGYTAVSLSKAITAMDGGEISIDWDALVESGSGKSNVTGNVSTGKSTGKSATEKQQEAYQAMFKIIEKNIEREISILEREKDKIDDFYQSQIDALKEQNDEIEKQIQLEELQERLAEARSQKKLVYVDGKFQYMDDLDAISEAQKALEDEQRVQALEKETDRLEELKDQEIANIQAQIDAWEQYKDEWSSVVDNYAEEQDALLVLQQLGIELEGENWKLRLNNLQDYVNEYKRISAQVSAEGSSISGSSPNAEKSETYKSDTGISVSATDVENARAFGLYAIQSSGRYAEGTTNAKGGISLVGEKGAELRVLNRGDGILPSSITDTLWRFGNNPASFINNLAGVSSGNSNCYSFSIGNITLPSVTDTDSFITGLKQMAKQRVMSRG